MNVTNITHPLSPDTRAAIARLLDAAGITARARPESVADLLAVATVQRLPANHFFCHRGEAVSSLILILEGKVDIMSRRSIHPRLRHGIEDQAVRVF